MRTGRVYVLRAERTDRSTRNTGTGNMKQTILFWGGEPGSCTVPGSRVVDLHCEGIRGEKVHGEF